MAASWSPQLAAFCSQQTAVRRQAAQQLAAVAPSLGAHAALLVRAAGDPDEEVRQWVTETLEQLGPPAAAEVPALARLLDAPAADVGYWAATLLGRCPEGSSEMVDALARQLRQSRHRVVRQRVAWALGRLRLQTPASEAALTEAAASTDARLARLARQALETRRAGG